MEFYEVLEKRHSSREFLEKEIEPEKLENIVNAAMSAPSAGNLQAYKIYAVQSEDAKKAMVNAAVDQHFLSDAAVLLVFCADKKASETKYGQRGMELYAIQDATIAAAYSQLAATAEGIASVWVGAFEPFEVSYIIHADAYEVPVAIIALGYAAGPLEERSRKSAEEIIREV